MTPTNFFWMGKMQVQLTKQKRIRADQRFCVHERSRKMYQIFCEYFLLHDEVSMNFLNSKVIFDVVCSNDIYYFFDNFIDVMKLQHNDHIIINIVNIDDDKIEELSCYYLMNFLIRINKIDINFYHSIKSNLPKNILKNHDFSIKKILQLKNLKRYQYDYQMRLLNGQKITNIPLFSQLIFEARYEK